MDDPLVDIFGKNTVLEITDILMTHPSAEYSKEDLAEIIGVSEDNIHGKWSLVERAGIARKRREDEETDFYSLNTDSEVVKALYHLDQALRDRMEELEAEGAEQTLDA